MCPANEVNVFSELVIGGIEISRVGCSCADGKAITLHRNPGEAFKRAINLNAENRRRKVRDNHAIIASAVESRVRREDRLRADQIGVTENEGLRAIELYYPTNRP